MSHALREGMEVVGPLAERLNGIGRFLLAFMLDQDHRAFIRLLRQERPHAASLSRAFFEAGLDLCRSRIAGLLDEAAQAGVITVDEPTLAAADLLALWSGLMEAELQFGVISAPSDAEIRRRVDRGTKLFLKACAGEG